MGYPQVLEGGACCLLRSFKFSIGVVAGCATPCVKVMSGFLACLAFSQHIAVADSRRKNTNASSKTAIFGVELCIST
jgi:hypothetical protein